MNSPINDEEDLLKALQNYIKTNLNIEIDAINLEKNDWKIDEIVSDDKHYVYSGELLDLPNHAFVNFSIDGVIEMKNNFNDISSTPTIMIEVVFDNPKKANTYFKSLRYMTAVYQTVLNFASSTSEVDGFQVDKITPIIVNAKSLQRELVISGVSISCSIG